MIVNWRLYSDLNLHDGLVDEITNALLRNKEPDVGYDLLLVPDQQCPNVIPRCLGVCIRPKRDPACVSLWDWYVPNFARYRSIVCFISTPDFKPIINRPFQAGAAWLRWILKTVTGRLNDWRTSRGGHSATMLTWLEVCSVFWLV